MTPIRHWFSGAADRDSRESVFLEGAHMQYKFYLKPTELNYFVGLTRVSWMAH